MAAWGKKIPPQPPKPEKGEDHTAISRINRLIAEENEKMKECHQRIGEKYVQLHSTDYEESFSDLIQSLNVSQRKLVDYSMQMQFVTGVIVCTHPGCGNKAPKGSVYCNMCGSKLPEFHFENYEMCEACCSLVEKGTAVCPNCKRPMKPQNDNLVKCHKCGELVGKDNRFCPICGEPLVQTGSNGGAGNPPKEKKCPNPMCGAMMSPDKLFCTECGMKLN